MCRLSGTLAVRIAEVPVSRRRYQATKEPCAFARRAKSQGEALAVGVGAKTTILASTADTLALQVGGLAVVVCFGPIYGRKQSAKGMASPRKGRSPGSSRGLDARRLEENPGQVNRGSAWGLAWGWYWALVEYKNYSTRRVQSGYSGLFISK